MSDKRPVPIKFVDHILNDDKTYDADGHAFRHDLPAGCVRWLEDQSGNPHACLTYTCPCGCGAVGAINVNKGQKLEHAWLWDGDVEKPTLTPSILKIFGCRWHGYLTKGEFVSC